MSAGSSVWNRFANKQKAKQWSFTALARLVLASLLNTFCYFWSWERPPSSACWALRPLSSLTSRHWKGFTFLDFWVVCLEGKCWEYPRPAECVVMAMWLLYPASLCFLIAGGGVSGGGDQTSVFLPVSLGQGVPDNKCWWRPCIYVSSYSIPSWTRKNLANFHFQSPLGAGWVISASHSRLPLFSETLQ